MAITLPLVNQLRPLIRLAVAPHWAPGTKQRSSTTSYTQWTVMPTLAPGENGYGFEVVFWERTALPVIGTAELRLRFGEIDGKVIAPDAATAARLRTGVPWDGQTDLIEAPDLTNQEIRIQVAPRVDNLAEAKWKTAWWGTCDYHQDTGFGGRTIPSGERTYHCIDGFARTKDWPLARHGFYVQTPDEGSQSTAAVTGHPGYNVARGAARLGNKAPSGAVFFPNADQVGPTPYHTTTGTGEIWTDREAVDSALALGRPNGEPLFTLKGTTELYAIGDGGCQPVTERDTAFTFVSRICRRQRGRGLAWVDWEDDTSAPLGPLDICLRVQPQTYRGITWKKASIDTTITLPGAVDAVPSTAIDIDLIGDARVRKVTIAARDQNRYDAVESVGEYIQVLATLSTYDRPWSLAGRWNSARAAAFIALPPAMRTDESWREVFQLYGLPRAFAGYVQSHDLGAVVPMHRCDYRCRDDGRIIFPGSLTLGSPDSGTNDTSPLLIEVMPDLPLFEGYLYDHLEPRRADGLAETGQPNRRPPLILLRFATVNDRYFSGNDVEPSLTVSINPDGMMIYAPQDHSAQGATRAVSDKTHATSLGAAFDTSQLGVTVGLRLPHRVRLLTTTGGSAASARKTLVVTHDDLHLWLASPGAIWDLDATKINGNGRPAKRFACHGTVNSPGILRDDRDVLAHRHALACSWFLNVHRPVVIELDGCGFLPSYEVATDLDSDKTTTKPYWSVGQVISRLSALGQRLDSETPITAKRYEVAGNVTRWTSDWADLDYQN